MAKQKEVIYRLVSNTYGVAPLSPNFVHRRQRPLMKPLLHPHSRGQPPSEPLSFFSFLTALLQPLVYSSHFTTQTSHPFPPFSLSLYLFSHPCKPAKCRTINNNDNKSIVSPPLRPARPGKALMFLRAIEIGS
ncbi:hypothetical protein H5410_016341 [Solanum commersonii]|uniref:Uncharacterized protein n=1 Tax=Solanum commersonii TaxID=4109 RepID=A0A9J5ZW00_SOLCO|nr:hypothetical protein H5410_016341 [Solanum commersonii]